MKIMHLLWIITLVNAQLLGTETINNTFCLIISHNGPKAGWRNIRKGGRNFK